MGSEAVSPQNNPPNSDKNRNQRQLVNRFVSTFSGAFKAFFLYRQDNKALDEIVKNVHTRFVRAMGDIKVLTLGVTHQSLTFDGSAIGFREVTVYLASTLYTLGIKEITIKNPIQSRHFFAILNILTSKETDENKIEKLIPYFSESEDRPIILTPLTSNSLVVRLSDEMIRKTLSPLTVPKDQGGPGFAEDLAQCKVQNLPDLYSWISERLTPVEPESLKNFVNSMLDATREGHFPIERFVGVFPLPEDLKNRLNQMLQVHTLPIHPRRVGPLGHHFYPNGKAPEKRDYLTLMTSFSQDEVAARKEMVISGAHQSSVQDLEFAQALMAEKGSNFAMGLRFLLRVLDNENTMAVQEKALKLGIGIWSRFQNMTEDAQMMSLLSSLRQKLCAVHNMTLIFYPLRTLTIESEMFRRISGFISSLGEASLPSLLQSLEVEEERSMRKKLITIISQVAKERGSEVLLESMSKAPNFLLRNLIMILGDIKNLSCIDAVANYLTHSVKIVRIEAVRTLAKLGSQKAMDALYAAYTRVSDLESKVVIINCFVSRKDRKIMESAIRLAKDPKTPNATKNLIYQAIGTLGGPRAKGFLESLQKGSSFLGRFNEEEKKTQDLIKILLDKMK